MMHHESRRSVLRSGLLVPFAGTAAALWRPEVAGAAVRAVDLDLEPNGVVAVGAYWRPSGGLLVPVISFGTYNTPVNATQAAVEAALAAGVWGVDTAAAYGNEAQVGSAIRAAGKAGKVAVTTKILPSAFADVRGAIERSRSALGDGVGKPLVLLHSPLASPVARLKAYEALLLAEQEGLCSAIGVANWGAAHLDALAAAGLPAPAVVQLELSPFNQRGETVRAARARGSVVQASTWSKLSGQTGAKNWGRVKAVAEQAGCTPQQVLIAWSLARGFLVTPKAPADSPAVRENAPPAMAAVCAALSKAGYLAPWPVGFDLCEEGLKTGALGRTDGWGLSDVSGAAWDPTLVP